MMKRRGGGERESGMRRERQTERERRERGWGGGGNGVGVCLFWVVIIYSHVDLFSFSSK